MIKNKAQYTEIDWDHQLGTHPLMPETVLNHQIMPLRDNPKLVAGVDVAFLIEQQREAMYGFNESYYNIIGSRGNTVSYKFRAKPDPVMITKTILGSQMQETWRRTDNLLKLAAPGRYVRSTVTSYGLLSRFPHADTAMLNYPRTSTHSSVWAERLNDIYDDDPTMVVTSQATGSIDNFARGHELVAEDVMSLFNDGKKFTHVGYADSSFNSFCSNQTDAFHFDKEGGVPSGAVAGKGFMRIRRGKTWSAYDYYGSDLTFMVIDKTYLSEVEVFVSLFVDRWYHDSDNVYKKDYRYGLFNADKYITFDAATGELAMPPAKTKQLLIDACGDLPYAPQDELGWRSDATLSFGLLIVGELNPDRCKWW